MHDTPDAVTITKDMIAFRWSPGATAPAREVVPVPAPRADQVLVHILAGGLCHSDVSILDPSTGLGSWQRPFTLGHEGAGVIVALGSAVPETHPHIKLDAYVAVYTANACFEVSCSQCSLGQYNLCSQNAAGQHGLGLDGAWAKYCVISAECVVPVPGDITSMPPAAVAVATDAVLTPYNAMKTCNNIQPGQTVLIIGCGGLGHNAIQIAKNCVGAGFVIACDIREATFEAATAAGADIVAKPDTLASAAEGYGKDIDIVFDFVGNQQTFDAALSLVKPCGTIHIIGLGVSAMQVPMLQSARKNVTIKTSFWGRRDDLMEVLDYMAAGKIIPLVETRPLEDCIQVFEDFRDGKVKARIAFVP